MAVISARGMTRRRLLPLLLFALLAALLYATTPTHAAKDSGKASSAGGQFAEKAPLTGKAAKEAAAAALDALTPAEAAAAAASSSKSKWGKIAKVAPKGGVRVIKDMLTGKLKPLPTKEEATETAKEITELEAGPARDGKGGKEAMAHASATSALKAKAAQMSSVVAAALEKRAQHNKRRQRGSKKDDRKHKDISIINAGGKSKEADKHAGAGSTSKPLHVQVGSSSGASDVINDGVVSAAWNISAISSAKDVNASLVDVRTDFSDFFLWRQFKAGDKEKRIITAQKPFVLVSNKHITRTCSLAHHFI